MPDHSFAAAFFGLFNLTGLLAFLGGILATYIYCWAKDRYHDRTDPMHKPHRTAFRSMLLLWMLVYIVVGYIALQQQAQSMAVHRLAEKTEHCQQEFMQGLKNRAQAADESDKWSNIKTGAVAEWMHNLTFPPPEMAARRTTNPQDPIYIKWALGMTDHYFEIIDNANQQQQEAIDYRRTHPLPEPTCGK